MFTPYERAVCTRRTALLTQDRGLLSEYAVVSTQGHKAFVRLLAELTDPNNDTVSVYLKVQLRFMAQECHQLNEWIAGIHNFISARRGWSIPDISEAEYMSDIPVCSLEKNRLRKN